MKAVILFVAFALVLSLRGQAQHNRVGLTLGAAKTWLTGPTPYSEVSSRKGLVAGLVGYWQLPTPALGLQAELLYARKGEKEHFTVGGTLEDRVSMLDYVQLPLLLRGQRKGVTLDAGPYVAYLTGVRVYGVNYRPYGTLPFKRLDAGYVVGVGYQVLPSWHLGLRYTEGLRGVYQWEQLPDRRAMNQTLQVQGTYTLPLGQAKSS